MPSIPQVHTSGAIRSGRDYRDAYASVAAAAAAPIITLPPTYHTDLGPVLMQNQIPACVAHDVVYLMKLYHFRKTGQWIDLSPRFLDILSWEPDLKLEDGRRPRTVMKIAANTGCCTTALLPNDTTLPLATYRDKSIITQAMKDEAALYKIPGYISVEVTPQATRAAIYLYGAVTALFEIGDEFYTAASGQTSWADSDIDPLRTPASIIGGHQIAPNGWTDPTFNTVRNEWSEAWANKGENRYDPAAWQKYIVEQWAVAEIPTDATSFMKDLPGPTAFHYEWSTNLAYGEYNDDIKWAQVALMILGFLVPIPADELGYYGPKTATAVEAFQTSQRIAPTAAHNIGPKTRAALNSLFATN